MTYVYWTVLKDERIQLGYNRNLKLLIFIAFFTVKLRLI